MFYKYHYLPAAVVATATTIGASPNTTWAKDPCMAEKRLAGAELVIDSYNRVESGASAAGFNQLPLTYDCHIDVSCLRPDYDLLLAQAAAEACRYRNPNGGPSIPFAIDEATTKDFAIETRQVSTQVTGEYTDFPDNTSTIIHTNVVHSLRLTSGIDAGQEEREADAEARLWELCTQSLFL